MKKNKISSLLVVLFVTAVGFVVVKYKNAQTSQDKKIYTLLSRTGSDTATAEWISLKLKVAGYDSILKADPANIQANLNIAATFIQEARVTGNHLYYDKAAFKHVDNVLKVDSSNFSALCYKSLLLLSQHHFTEGLETGKKAQAINPNNAFIYGLLTDAYVELGNYKSAVETSDKMQTVKPDIRSYSRASYLREIYGDYPGSIEAMKLAVAAGPAGTEGTEWARIQLAHLYELTGQIKNAENLYLQSLLYRPDYAYAYSGLARVAITNKQYDQAINYYVKADSLVADNSIKEEMADVYFFLKKEDKAKAIIQEVLNQLSKDAESATDDNSLGHYSDNELALNYLKIKEYNKALIHAELEYNRRPENITVNETMAWVYYKKGDSAKALQYIKAALKTNSKNPELLCRAAFIYHLAGDKVMAKNLLQQALENDPNFNILLKMEATDLAKKL